MQALPVFCMGVFRLPSGLCDELEKMMNSFWWRSKRDGRKNMHWLSWSSMCRSKMEGGLGFRKLQAFNTALLGKQLWRMHSDPHSLVARVLKAKYFPHGDITSAPLGSNPSFTWRSLLSAREMVCKVM